MFSMRALMLVAADRDLYNSQMSEREGRFLRIAWQKFANSAASLGDKKLLTTKQLLQSNAVVEAIKDHVATRLMCAFI